MQYFQFALILILLLSLQQCCGNKRLYTKQFPDNSEHFELPPTILFSLFMGSINYPHLPLLLESMRWNPKVDFVLINVYQDIQQLDHINLLKEKYQVSNFRVVPQSMQEFSMRVKDRLGIDVKFNMNWYYKMCDYKPVLAHLFPELLEPKHKYWGFADTDVIWGNISRYALWFQGSMFVITGWWDSNGACQFFLINNITTTFFNRTSFYIPALTNISYFNLDEAGVQTQKDLIIDEGRHSIASMMLDYTHKNHIPLNRGIDWQDRKFYDEGDCLDWIGPVRWHRGSLQIIHGSPEFPPEKEVMFFHRPYFAMNIPESIRFSVFEDMMIYGFLLPYWIPLSSRYMSPFPLHHERNSTLKALVDYKPYHIIRKIVDFSDE